MRALDVPDDELLARILASPGDERIGQRSTHRRRAAVLAIAVAAAVLLASTAFAVSNWLGGGAVKPPVTRSEYRLAQRELTLPPGYAWPNLHVDANSVTSPGAGGGHAVAIAQNAWECYWVDAFHRGDAAAEERAHRTLETLLHRNVVVAPAGASENWSPPTTPGVPRAVYADDGGYQWKEMTYARAARGDVRGLEESCRANARG